MERINKQAERDREIVRIVETYSDMLMRIALNRVNSIAEAEDVVQSTFERLMRRQPTFDSREHEKAWLIRTAIRICIGTLPEKDRDAVYLYYYEEYSTKDVAKILGEREGTTRSRLSRARQKLRTIMKGETDEQVL